jgi:hypothetical protein
MWAEPRRRWASPGAAAGSPGAAVSQSPGADVGWVSAGGRDRPTICSDRRGARVSGRAQSVAGAHLQSVAATEGSSIIQLSACT